MLTEYYSELAKTTVDSWDTNFRAQLPRCQSAGGIGPVANLSGPQFPQEGNEGIALGYWLTALGNIYY